MGRKSPAKSNPRGVKVDTQTEKPLTKSGTGMEMERQAGSVADWPSEVLGGCDWALGGCDP